MLRDTQKRIANWIRAPEGVAAALAEAEVRPGIERESTGRHQLDSLVRSDATLDAARRLEIYANAYFHRIHDVLVDDYPALSRAMGASAFHDLVTSYLLVEPSRHPSLRYVGRRLPGFLASHDAASGIRARSPWAPDLAALEWARVDVFDASDQAILTREDLVSLSPETFASLDLRLGPWVRVLALEHPVDGVWRSATDDASAEIPAVEPGPTRILVWRKEERVVHRVLDASEAAALGATTHGVRFDRLCELVASFVGDEAAPTRSAGWLEQWLADGVLVAVADDPAPEPASTR